MLAEFFGHHDIDSAVSCRYTIVAPIVDHGKPKGIWREQKLPIFRISFIRKGCEA
jgi:hypothetical protein